MLAPYKNPLSPQVFSVGSDLLASLSIGLYEHPLTLYRELIQNAADAYETLENKTQPRSSRRVDITIDRQNRSLSVKDYALGLNPTELQQKMLTLGQSTKHNLRGFRGIGRLAGLGLCKSLCFRSRTKATEPITEITFDAQTFLHLLDQNNSHKEITDILQAITAVTSPQPEEIEPPRFFECRLYGVRRTENDQLLNLTRVRDYIAEHCPVPLPPSFPFTQEIDNILGEQTLFSLDIRINDEPSVCRPFFTSLTHREKTVTTFTSLESINDFDTLFAQKDQPLARGWILHHDYPGALPESANIRGLRIRAGNIQVGDNGILRNCFPEPRFNKWCVGEIHILDPKLKPNTLRSNFEFSPLWSDFLNCVSALCFRLQETCRGHSQKRSQTTRKSMTLSANVLPQKTLASVKKAARQHIKTQSLPEHITIKLNT